jgi:hypothetical protein
MLAARNCRCEFALPASEKVNLTKSSIVSDPVQEIGGLFGRGFTPGWSAISGGMWLGSAERGEIRRRDSPRAL